MNFTIKVRTLSAAVTLLRTCTGGDAISGSLRLMVDGDQLRLQAVDFDVRAELVLPLDGDHAPGLALVPSAPLQKALSHLPHAADTMVRLTAVGSTRLKIECGRSAFDLAALDPENAPPTSFAGTGERRGIGAATLARLMTVCAPCVATEEDQREVLHNVQVEIGQSQLVAVSTDGVGLSMYATPHDGPPQPLRLHRRAVNAIHATRVRAAGAADTMEVFYAPEPGRQEVWLYLGDVTIVAKHSDAAFPQWRRVVPAPAVPLVFDRAAMLATIRRIGLLAQTDCLSLRSAGDALEVSTTTTEGEHACEQLEQFNPAAPAILCNLNGDRLARLLRTFNSDRIELHWHSAEAPMAFRSDGDPGVTQVLTPMRQKLAKPASHSEAES